MKSWLLLVHNDEDVLDRAERAVRPHAAGSAATQDDDDADRLLVRARNLSEASKMVRGLDAARCELIVLGAATPADRTSSVGGTTREPTKAFIKTLKLAHPRLPIIVLSSDPDRDLSTFLSAYDRTAWIDFKPATPWEEELAKRAQELDSGVTGKAAAVLEVDITLERGTATVWRLERRGNNPLEDAGTLYTNEDGLQRIIEKSRRLEGEVRGPYWHSVLTELAEDLGRLLFQETSAHRDFWEKFVEHREQTGGMENTRIRFTVSDATHPVFVEALKYGRTKNFWMLLAPIFRRYDHSVSRLPLFKDAGSRQGPVNCLVIEADPEDGMIGNRAMAKLRHVGTEASNVASLLDRGAAHGMGKVEHFALASVPGEARALVAALYAKLAERQWHLVHFAGHVAQIPRVGLANKVAATQEEEDDKVAALVLSAARGCALDVVNFVDKLEFAQFLYMSSCRSADSYVVAHAAKAHVPAVLGYRWTVEDTSAAAFADAFYTKLLSGGASYKYLEYAFRDARKITYKKDVNDPTWASPVLMMQLKQQHAQPA